MIRLLPTDQTLLRTQIIPLMVGQSDFECCIHGLRSGVGEKHMVQWIGKMLNQSFCIAKDEGVSSVEVMGKIQLCQLIRNRLVD